MQFYNVIGPIASKQGSKVQLVKHNPPFFGHFDKLSWVHFRLCIIILLLTKSVRGSIISASKSSSYIVFPNYYESGELNKLEISNVQKFEQILLFMYL